MTINGAHPELLVEVDGGIAVVTLNRPQKRNAISSSLLDQLRRALAGLDADDEVSAVVLTGAGVAFCAGLDLDDPSARDVESGTPWPPLSKPMIGAINGAAVTGGLEVALNCDFLVASDRAAFADTHARIGAMPGWGLPVLLPRRIGLARAVEMSLTGNFMDAGEALERGLVNHVVAHDELLPLARRLAADIAASSPDAVRLLLDTYRRVAATDGIEAARLVEAGARAAWRSGSHS